MRRIVEQLRAVGARRAALFVVITTAVAVGFYFSVRETGVGPRTEASVVASDEQFPASTQPDESGEGDTAGEAKKLSLTLTAPTTCEVERASREVHAIVVGKNEDTGEEQYKFGDYTDVPTVLVRWQASGGAPPYTLVIDGEPRDAGGAYVGKVGGALVSCALENGETYFSDRWGPMQRWHRTAPTVDSGIKTIQATVTDSTGATGSASIEVYAVRKVGSSGTTLEAGKTYRVHGHLVTVPLGTELWLAGLILNDCEGSNCESDIEISADDGPHGVAVYIGLRTGTYRSRVHEFNEALLPETDPRNRGGSREHLLHKKFDEFVSTIGRPPQVERP